MATPAQIAEKWQRRISQATQEITEGVNAVTENPATKAIAKKDKAILNYTNALNSGKWERGLSRVTLASWKDAMITKGIQRIQQGATQAVPKVQRFHANLQPYQEALKGQLETMPNDTIEDSINRMTFWARGMADFENT